MATAAEIAVDTLERAGVDHAFGLVGSTILSFLDEMKDSGITYVSTRHEQVATSAAAGYALASRRPTVTTCHVGPGTANQIIGVAAANRDFIPLVSVTGNEPISDLGKDINHEWDVMGVFDRFTKHNVQVDDYDPAHKIRHAALRSITGMPGAVQIDIPKDVADKEFDPPDQRSLEKLSRIDGRASRTRIRPTADAIDRVVDALAAAERPLLLAGAEMRWFDAAGPLREFAERLGMPVVTSGNARGALPESHRLSLGWVANSSLEPALEYARSADLVLGIGTWFPDKVTDDWGLVDPDATVVQSTVRADQLDRFYVSDVGLVADPASVLRDLVDAVDAHGDLPTFDALAESVHEDVDAHREQLLEVDESVDGIDPRAVVHAVRDTLDDFTYTTGGGVHNFHAKLLRVDDLNGYFETSNFTGMSQGFPLALGAKLALGERPVLTFEGDGGFAMVLQDLETAVREDIPVKVIVLNNDAYMSHLVRQREWYDDRIIGTTHGNPRFDAVAEDFGATGIHVETPEEVEDGVRELVETEGVAVLEVPVDPEVGSVHFA